MRNYVWETYSALEPSQIAYEESELAGAPAKLILV